MRMPAPYELSLLSQSKAPAVIASWFSSALENLETFGVRSELWAFRIPDGGLASETLSRSAREFYSRRAGLHGQIKVHDLQT